MRTLAKDHLDEIEAPLDPRDWAESRKRKPRLMRNASEIALVRNKPYIVKGLFYRRQVSIFPGPSGAKKTFLGYFISYALAFGSHVFGRRARATTILICALEPGSLDERIAAAKMMYGDTDRVFITEEPLNLFTDKHAAQALIDQALECGATFIWIDNLSAAMAGIRENEYTDVSIVIERLRHVAIAIDGHVACMAHTGKDPERGQRGSSHWFASADVVVAVRADGDDCVVEVAKARDARTGDQYRFRTKHVDLGLDSEGDAISSLVLEPVDSQGPKAAKPKLTDLQRLRFDFIQNLFADPNLTHPDTVPAPGMGREVCVRRSDVLSAMERKGWIARVSGKGLADKERQKFRDILTTLEGKGLLWANENWVWLR